MKGENFAPSTGAANVAEAGSLRSSIEAGRSRRVSMRAPTGSGPDTVAKTLGVLATVRDQLAQAKEGCSQFFASWTGTFEQSRQAREFVAHITAAATSTDAAIALLEAPVKL
jgi:hypothetical protein